MSSADVLANTAPAHWSPPANIPMSAPGPPVISARGLTRVWGRGESAQVAVDHVDLDIARGEVLAIIGPSGSGKSTLGSMLAGIDRPTSGTLVAAGTALERLDDDQRARWRSRNVGIVFQDFHLLTTLTAMENVELALRFAGVRRGRRRSAARAALDEVGLAAKAHRLPSQLSGGEQQRVGIARAMAVQPGVLVADEPTGSLDRATGRAVFELLVGLANRGTTVIFITHDDALADAATRVVTMVDGRIAGQVRR